MQKQLAQPVSLGSVAVGSVRLAPTTELAGLADLAVTTDDDARLALLCEIARSIAAEDAVRDHIRSLRSAAAGTAPLPQRRVRAERRSA